MRGYTSSYFDFPIVNDNKFIRRRGVFYIELIGSLLYTKNLAMKYVRTFIRTDKGILLFFKYTFSVLSVRTIRGIRIKFMYSMYGLYDSGNLYYFKYHIRTLITMGVLRKEQRCPSSPFHSPYKFIQIKNNTITLFYLVEIFIYSICLFDRNKFAVYLASRFLFFFFFF